MNSAATMAAASSNPGNVITKMIARTVLMKKIASTDLALQANLRAPTNVVYLWPKFVTVSMIVKIMSQAMRLTNGAQETPPVHQITLNAKRQTFALSRIGCVTATTTVETTATKIHSLFTKNLSSEQFQMSES